ncbi:hypothetical protein MBLNU230_g3518t1 [Neophaeotheca triangularis]
MISHTFLVAGDVSCDYLIYSMSPYPTLQGFRHSSESESTQLAVRLGGASLVAQLLTAGASQWGFEVKEPCVDRSNSCLRDTASSIIDLHWNYSKQAQPVFQVTGQRHVDKTCVWHSPRLDHSSPASPNTVVITGSSDSFEDVEPALDFLQRAQPTYIVHHMTRPLAIGRLWDLIRNGPLTSNKVPVPENLVVIVDADDLRSEGITLSESLSWEATAEDFVRNLGSNGRLDTLATCPNLVVRFGSQGVIHHQGRAAYDPVLYFNPRETEVSRNQHSARKCVIGSTPAFVAGFSMGFADSGPPSSDRGIKTGLAVAQRFVELGFVPNPQNHSPEYPAAQVMDGSMDDNRFTSVRIPSARISSGDSWSIFEAVTGDPAEIARQIVVQGEEKTLAQCPITRYGELSSIDRTEQENLGAVSAIVLERIASQIPQPTCIGVFGPPGSGKKFMTANLVKHFGADTSFEHLTVDCHTLEAQRLIDIWHTIRDNTVLGIHTAVSFAGFEALLASDGPLMNDITRVMRDGTFSDQGQARSTGPAILFLLVDQNTPPSDAVPTPSRTTFAETPVVDDSRIVNSLHGIIRTSGPNEQAENDRMFPVRRAIVIRRLLLQHHPHLRINGNINIDEAVLHALLLVPRYKHGNRSLSKIISTSRLSGRTKFDVSALPPEEQIQLHVDGKTFMSYLRAPKLPPALRETLAMGMYEVYKTQRHAMATATEREQLATDHSICDWDDLAGELKESTRAQADDIPRKLRAIGCFMLNEDRSAPLVRVRAFEPADLLMLSEMEHERFNAERLQRQWRMGPRAPRQRTTPFLVPWRDLEQKWKDVDTVMVEVVPRILDGAGWRIYKMQDSGKANG